MVTSQNSKVWGLGTAILYSPGVDFVDAVRAAVCGWLGASNSDMGVDIQDGFSFFPLAYIRWLVASLQGHLGFLTAEWS